MAIWKQSLYEGDQGKMKSFGWALIQHKWCLYSGGGERKENLDAETDMQRKNNITPHRGKNGHVTGIMHPQAKKHQWLLEAKKGQKGFSSRAFRNSMMVQTS